MENASEIAGLRTLQSISTRLISESTPQFLHRQILDAAMALMAADAATIQMLAADGKSRMLLASKNFHPDSVAFWQRVAVGAGSSCGQAPRDNERVVVADIEACDFLAGTPDQREYRRSGIRSVQSTPLRSRSGQLLGMLSTHWRAPHTPTEDDFRLFDALARQAADLIERALADDALRESEERFRHIANTAPVMIWMSDVEKQITFLNQTWLDYTGRPLDAALGHQWIAVLHPDEVERCRDAYGMAFDQREPFQVEHRLRRHDGEYRWAVSTGVPRYNADGSFAGYIGTAIDLTERKLAEEVLSTVSQRLIEAQEEERAHVARELHDDINQRLTLIGFRLDGLAQDSALSMEELRQKIHDSREEVGHLVKDVQALSHRLHPPSLDYLGFEAVAAGLCREVSRDVAVSFHAESVPTGISERISLCLYRVLQESLQNATKHSGARHVEVRLRGGADQIELTIRDSGAGFDPEAAFKGRGRSDQYEETADGDSRTAFHRLEASGRHDDSSVGALALRPVGIRRGSDTPVPARRSTCSAWQTRTALIYRVLVVDDYEPWRRHIESALQASPRWVVVGEAADGLDAVEKAEALRPDLILLDVGLPTLNGIEAARRILALDPDTRILFLSENQSWDVVEAALGVGGPGYVLKSDAGRDLLSAMEAVVEGQRFISRSLTGRGLVR